MEFAHSFYEDEIRCDFLIPSMVKRTWAAQMQILDDLDRACATNDLSYYAEWGTLLGAIRHAGFIPWDDDMDVCMPRRDYHFLIDNVSSILPDDYSIVSYRSNRDFKQMLCRIVSSDHYRFDPEYMHKYSGLPFALGIDIFPLDFLTDDEEYERKREQRARLIYAVVNELGIYNTPIKILEGNIRQIESECKVGIDRKGDVLTQLRMLLEKQFGEVDEKDAKYITLYPIWMGNHDYKFPVEYYGAGIRFPFENMTIPVPVCYDDILKRKYGNSYMTQIRSGGAHEYPYFENHVNVLREHFGFEWPSYRFNANDLAAQKCENTDGNGSAFFITYSAKAFDNMRDLARKYIDDGLTVTIVPVTKYDIAPDMTGITVSDDKDEDDLFKAGLEEASVVRDLDITRIRADVIVTDYPYDEYNLITTINKVYYSSSLRAHCNRLVYVPAFEADSITDEDERAKKLMPLYVCTPMAARCDEIVLHSEEMKKRYVDCLSDFSGEDRRDIWEKKITVLQGHKLSDHTTERSRRSIMFYIGFGMFAGYGIRAVEKIKEVFEIFDENADKADVVFVHQDGLMDNLKERLPDLFDMYTKSGFCEAAGVYDPGDIDAYYGEASALATEFLNMKKPVMLMNVNI